MNDILIQSIFRHNCDVMNDLISQKICSCCKINKIVVDNFRLCEYKNGNTYYHSICKECNTLNAREYARNNKEERKTYQTNYNVKNPNYKKDWKAKNKEKINKQERIKRATDINFKLMKNVSRAISRSIVKNGKSSFDYLEYTAQELKEHLIRQFDANMTLDNYGSYWHIDHIIPKSLFKYESMEDQSFKDCWALSNLRPLEAKQNMLDGATKIRHKIYG